MTPTGRPLNIGISCYPTLGGSGVVATELGMALADRGHRVHFVCYDTPRRFEPRERVFLHNVVAADYPVFQRAPYVLALASKLVQVAEWHDLDIIHAHYALPHAASAFLARAILAEGDKTPKIVTTLHGTDVTIVGADESYRRLTRFSVQQSDAITAPSEFLRQTAQDLLQLDEATEIEVIANFVDTVRFQPAADAEAVVAAHERVAGLFDCCGPAEALPADAPTLVHVSNFRPVKRTLDVIEVFAQVNRGTDARLLMVGDGPERSRAETHARQAGLAGRVRFLGQQDHVGDLLRASDLLLLPSETESFGLAALEAASCGVPVVASRVGGLPEVVVDGVTGLLAPVGDVGAFSAHVTALLADPARRRAMGRAARARACEHFSLGPAVERYEALFRRVVGSTTRP